MGAYLEEQLLVLLVRLLDRYPDDEAVEHAELVACMARGGGT
jgi:hypothetical protein